MSAIRIELKGAIVIAHWPERPTVSDVQAFFDEMEKLLQAAPRAVVLNALAVATAPFDVREAATQRLKSMNGLLRRTVLGEATVLSSVLVRGALAAIHLLSSPGYPTKTFSRLEDAMTWAEAQVQGERRRHSA